MAKASRLHPTSFFNLSTPSANTLPMGHTTSISGLVSIMPCSMVARPERTSSSDGITFYVHTKPGEIACAPTFELYSRANSAIYWSVALTLPQLTHAISLVYVA
jgi:hypothetical protein